MSLTVPSSIRLARLFCLSLFACGLCAAQANPSTPQNLPSPLRDPSLSQRAEKGEPKAQFLVARDYHKAKNYDQALVWYGKSAAQGYALAQTALGWMYEKGEGVPPNVPQALEWFRKAADQDEPAAENNLAVMYVRGEGTAIDLLQAKNLLQKSAEHGWPPAQANLAFLYSSDFAKDPNSAYMLCILALAAGRNDCRAVLEKVRDNMSPADVTASNQRVMDWYKARSASGRSPAYAGEDVPDRPPALADYPARIAKIYLLGIGVPEDDVQGARWARIGAEQGLAVDQWALGRLYDQGRGVPKDERQAVLWFQKSAAQGYAPAETDLGTAYLKGVGITRDENRAIEWLLKAANQDFGDAQAVLGLCYETGRGTERNIQKAAQWYEKAATHNNPLALNNLAWLYATSQDPKLRQPTKAVDYAYRAVQLSKEKEPLYLDTLAAAYFAAGRQADAIASERKAMALVPSDPSFKEHFEKYSSVKPGDK
jgi:TPR repeat protein